MKNLSLIIICCLCGCALFQKTSKSTTVASHSALNQLESSQLVLKNTGKETQIFTYWSDTGLYQYQYIKEQLDQAKLSNLKAEEQLQTKQNITTKKAEPVQNWVYILLFIGLIVCFLVFRKFFLPAFRL